MATGIVNTTALTAGNIATLTKAYTVPTNYYGIYNISFTNTATVAAQIRLYIGASTTGSPVASECIEYSTTIVPGGVFERTGLALGAGTNIIVGSSLGAGSPGSSTGPVNVNVYGIETSTS
jgi:hypothetical protein